MKVLGNLSVNKDSNVNYPFGANIQNETDTINGTPVIREIYGDVLMNLYRILELTNVNPTGIEDDKTTQFQLVEALKKLPNSLNDIEQVLTLSGSVWSVPFDLSILPNKYIFIARASDNYVGNTTFKGTGSTEYNFVSTGFNASDEVLVVIDNSNVRAYSLSKLSQTPEFLNTLFPYPLEHNNTNQLFYYQFGNLYKNFQVWNIENSIRLFKSDPNLVINKVFLMQGYFVCIVKNQTTLNYEFYCFDALDLNTVIPLTTNIVQTNGVDYEPYFYGTESYVYATNGANRDVNDNYITEISFDGSNLTFNESTNLLFDVSFVKKEKGAIYNDKLYIFNSYTLSTYDINTGVKNTLGNFPSIFEYLFVLNNTLYLNQTNIAHKLNL